MKSCEEWQAQAEPYLDGALTAEEEQHFLSHISSCPECSDALEFAKAVRKSLGELPGIDVPEDFCEKLHKRIDSEKSGRRRLGTYAKRYGALAACVVLAVVIKTGVGEYDFNKSSGKDELPVPYNEATTAPELPAASEQTAQPHNDINVGKAENTTRKKAAAVPTPEPMQAVEPIQTPAPVVSEEPRPETADEGDAAEKEAAAGEAQAVSVLSLADEENTPAAENEKITGRSSGGGSGSSGAAKASKVAVLVKITVKAESIAEAEEAALEYAEYSNGAYIAARAEYDAFLQKLAEREIEYICSANPQGDSVSFVISE